MTHGIKTLAIAALALFALLGAGLAALMFRETFTRALALWRP